MMCKYVVVKEERRAYISVLGAFDEELCSIRQLKWRMISIGSDGDEGWLSADGELRVGGLCSMSQETEKQR